MSEFKQTSFSGGMNYLLDDTRLPVSIKYKEGDSVYDVTYNQYRLGLNCRTRFDIATPTQSSVIDYSAPSGTKQGLVVFGNYLLLFVAGYAFYRQIGTSGWYLITNFKVNASAPRVWTVVVPLNTTNYARFATKPTTGPITTAQANQPIIQIQQAQYAASLYGNYSGVLVQDGTTQPWFIYINGSGQIAARQTQTYAQWNPNIGTDGTSTGPDLREYVPVGTYMEWYNGILFIVDSAYTNIYRSVSGRPLDFVVNVTPVGQAGGDATTTSYSVGVGGITALHALPNSGLLVSAGGGGMFLVTLNQSPTAPTLFGEYTFNRQVLFNASCVNERGIIDIPSASGTTDTLFIDANGIRSMAAASVDKGNEGRNGIFSANVQGLFKGLTQVDGAVCATYFDNYAIFGVNTTLGYGLLVYDTVNSCYQSLDIAQLNGAGAKQFAANTISGLNLFAITTDDYLYQLYAATAYDKAYIRLGSVCNLNPKKELKVSECRVIMTNITQECDVSVSLFTNNRYDETLISKIGYSAPSNIYTGQSVGTDIGTQTNSILFSFVEASQGWKSCVAISWTGGASLNTVSIGTIDYTPMQPLTTQSSISQS